MRENGRRERPQNRTDAKPCLSDVYKMSTQAKRRQADVRFCGRSMVEMLGVLAIIGVLSVGAMSGYSKAMFKYRLNKQAEQINQVMMALIQYRSIFTSVENHVSIVPTLIQFNALPPEMIRNNKAPLYDVFDIPIRITRTDGDSVYFIFGISKTSDTSHEICRNILEAFKAYESEMYAIGVNSTTAEDTNQQDWYYGPSSPLYKTRGIYMLDVMKMQSVCEKCDKNSCGIHGIVYHG